MIPLLVNRSARTPKLNRPATLIPIASARNPEPLVGQKRGNVPDEGHRAEGPEDMPQREEPEGAGLHRLRQAQPRHFRDFPACADRASGLHFRAHRFAVGEQSQIRGLASHDRERHAHDDGQNERSQHREGHAPAEFGDQEARERRHGQAPEANSGEGDAHGHTPLPGEPVRDQRLVRDPGRARDTDRPEHVERVELPDGLNHAHQAESRRHDERTDGHHPA
jgi:hypothetical protein